MASGDCVAIRLPNGPEFVVSWLALHAIGAIAVHLPPVYRKREIAHILNHSGARVVICGTTLVDDVEAARTNLQQPICITSPHAGAGSSRRSVDSQMTSPTTRWPDQIADHPMARLPMHPSLITYVASADGTLKGVTHSAAALLFASEAFPRDVLDLRADDVCIGGVSMSFAFGLGALLLFPLRAGAAAALVDSSPTSILDSIAATRATVLFGSPTLYRMLLRHPDLGRINVASLRHCVSAAEPLPPAVFHEWQARTHLEILDGFGTTELAHIVISSRPGSARAGFIGTIVNGYEARIVDESFHEKPRGEPGLLAVRGPTIASYWPDARRAPMSPMSSSSSASPEWILTGDVCIQDAGGEFRHVRRSDDLIVSAGYKISAREVERVLEEHPDVRHAEVFAVPDDVRGSSIEAIVGVWPGVETAGLPERLQRYMKQELASFKCPRRLIVMQVAAGA